MWNILLAILPTRFSKMYTDTDFWTFGLLDFYHRIIVLSTLSIIRVSEEFTVSRSVGGLLENN